MALICIKTTGRAMCAAAAFAAAFACAEPNDAVFLAARDAAARAQWRALQDYRDQLAGSVLAAYPAYWLLSGNLERTDPREVQDFLARYPDSPLAESLRREWLKVLGAAGAWDLFRAEYPKVTGDDVEIACYSFQERLARNDPDALPESRALFVSAREAPAACDPVFARALAEGALTEAQAWERLRRLLAAGSVKDAKRTNQLLPRKIAIVEKELDRANADPHRFLVHERLGKRPARDSQELLVFAFEKLARSKPDEAAERLAEAAPRLTLEEVQFAWGQVAYQAALSHHARALEWYGQADAATLTDSQIAWRARAAMRAANWKEVLASIQALSPQEAREPTWRYWRARALRNLGEKEAAEGLLKGLANQQNFYGLLAADELGIAVAPKWEGWRPEAADLERVRAIPGIQRALELHRLGLDNAAVREWIWVTRSLDDRSLLAAAELARQANEPDRAINIADRTVQLHDLAQRFPTLHREALAAAAKQNDLDQALVYGIIRQESRFNSDARSQAGAMGLMQLMPSTARWVARQTAVKPFTIDMLASPETNVQMGTYYLRRVMDALGHPILATAAYNAGPGRARRWLDERPLEGAIYTETIPFNETREYVKKVFTNAWFYRHRLTGKTVGMRELLGTVPGSASEPAVAANIP
ncbi:MAG TPA: transglycosylase SLT domain-containing protein [Usitatibacter sp.]|nr:transglycosylase SLT domain-containing protein [Usitatibacter sp.]